MSGFSHTQKKREIFFGRERDQRVIASNLYASSMTILYGAAGVGKSSVLMAGVVPMLRRKARTSVVIFRDWQHPDFLTALKRDCLQSVDLETKSTVKASADLPSNELLCSIGNGFGGTILILLDQFEDYFLYHPESEGANLFDSKFARAVNRNDVDANFLLSLREDGLSRLDRFQARIPNLMGNMLRLRHLDTAAAEDALVRTIIDQVRSGAVSLSSVGGLASRRMLSTIDELRLPFCNSFLRVYGIRNLAPTREHSD